MKTINVLVVDDSALFRRGLSTALESIPNVQVVGTANDGASALRAVPVLKPDLITLDLEMPGMGGIATLRQLKAMGGDHRVLIVSAHSTAGARLTVEALCHGADDFVTKVGSGEQSGPQHLKTQLEEKIKNLFPSATARPTPAPARPRVTPRQPGTPASRSASPEVLLIGVSTGGPNALSELFSSLPPNLPVPILLVQHMPAHFTRLLAERLSSRGGPPVSEAVDGEPILPGRAYVAPGDFHMEVQPALPHRRIRLTQDPKEHSCRPAVDVLFRTAAAAYKGACLGIVMTGMGTDGAKGAQAVVQAGGEILLQDPASAVVYGMPGAVVELGVRHEVVDLSRLGAAVVERLRRRSGPENGRTSRFWTPPAASMGR